MGLCKSILRGQFLAVSVNKITISKNYQVFWEIGTFCSSVRLSARKPFLEVDFDRTPVPNKPLKIVFCCSEIVAEGRNAWF